MRFKFTLMSMLGEVSKEEGFEADTFWAGTDAGLRMFMDVKDNLTRMYKVVGLKCSVNDVCRAFDRNEVAIVTHEVLSGILDVMVNDAPADLPITRFVMCEDGGVRFDKPKDKSIDNGRFVGTMSVWHKGGETTRTKVFLRKAESERYSSLVYFIKDECMSIKEFYFEGE